MNTTNNKSGGFTPLEIARPSPLGAQAPLEAITLKTMVIPRSEKPLTGQARTRFLTGFTLLEMLVAVSLFTVVAMLAVGSLLTLTNSRGITRQKEDLRGELRFLLDTLGREITWTVAIAQGCSPEPCTYETNELTFVGRVRPDVPEKEIRYRYDSVNRTVLKREQKTFAPCDKRGTALPASCEQQALSDDIKVESFKFIVSNNEDDESQATVTLAIKGYLDFKGERENFSVSSTYIPRFIQSQGALDTGPMTPTIRAAFQACTTDTNGDGFGDPPHRIVIQWIDDARHWMHIERCTGAGCTSWSSVFGTYNKPERDSTKFWTFNDTSVSSNPPNNVYRYRIRLYDHGTGTFGNYAETGNITVTSPRAACRPSGGSRVERPTSTGSSTGGEGDRDGRGGEE